MDVPAPFGPTNGEHLAAFDLQVDTRVGYRLIVGENNGETGDIVDIGPEQLERTIVDIALPSAG
jgi:hypothetical protein